MNQANDRLRHLAPQGGAYATTAVALCGQDCTGIHARKHVVVYNGKLARCEACWAIRRRLRAKAAVAAVVG